MSAHDLTPIEIASFKSVNKQLCRCDICSHRNIVHVAYSQKIHIIRLVRLRIDRISEKQKHIYFIAGDLCADLLTAALRAGKKFNDLQSGSFRNDLSGCTGSVKIVAAENAAVSDAKLYHKLFFCVMSDKCNIHKCFLLVCDRCQIFT